MATYINILFTLFMLLPGFLALRVCNSTKEYRELSTYQYTSISLGFSFIIILLWLLENYIIKSCLIIDYDFFENLKNLIVNGKLEPLFTSFISIFLITYINAFTLFSLLAYNCSWLGLFSKFTKVLGLIRFSPHLTPWEDFQILSKYNWIAVELKDGRTIFGKIGFGSHLPFDREIVLKRVDDSSILIFDKENKKVDFGPDIDLSYINYSEITNIHSMKDSGIEIVPHGIKDYSYVLFSLLLSLIFIQLFFTLLILNVDAYFTHSCLIEILLFSLTILSLTFNFKSLSKFS